MEQSSGEIQNHKLYIGDFQLVINENVWEMSYRIGWNKLKSRTVPFLGLSLFSIFLLLLDQYLHLDLLYNLLELEYPAFTNMAMGGIIIGLGGAVYDLVEKYNCKILISEKGLEVRKIDFSWEIVGEIERIGIKGSKLYSKYISIYTTKICFYVKNTDEYWEQNLKTIELSHKVDDKQLYINQLQSESMDFGFKIATKLGVPCQWEGFSEK